MMVQILAQMLKIHQRLNRLAKEKTELLKQNDVENLEKLLKAEEAKVHLLEEAERKRQAAVYDFMKNHGIEHEEPTMSVLSQYLTGKEKEQFQALHAELTEAAAELKRRNELNEQLTKQSLFFINAQLAMLSPDSQTSVTYQHPNDKKISQRRHSIFDSKA